MSSFRIVHLISDPYIEDRIPLAIMVWEGERTIVLALKIPSRDFLGIETFSLARMVLSDLRRVPSIHALPGSCGPQVTWTQDYEIPGNLQGEIAVSWVQKVFGPYLAEF